MNLLIAQTSGGFWMPQQVSTVAESVDGLFSFILWITVIFFMLIVVLLIVFIAKYRFRPGREKADRAPAHSTALELTWTIIPTVLVLMVFYFGFRGFLKMSVLPPEAYEIQATGSMWHWSFTYPNGHTEDELHIPINVPIRIVLSSLDVIHSLYLPQFRIKKDAVPKRYNQMWIQAKELGTFDIYCAEYCGQQHSQMRSKVVVQSLDDFKKWLEEASHWETHLKPEEGGKMLVSSNGCLQCHSIDGTTKNGPTFQDLFGRQEPMSDGSTVHVDENYIRESLYDPAAKVVRGFTVQMQSYRGRLRDKDVDAIIAYMKSISKNHSSTLPASTSSSKPATTP